MKSSWPQTMLSNQESCGADVSWCIDRSDYETVLIRALSVCSQDKCQEHLSNACTRTLVCGHKCAGVREEEDCLGCLQCPGLCPNATAGACHGTTDHLIADSYSLGACLCFQMLHHGRIRPSNEMILSCTQRVELAVSQL